MVFVVAVVVMLVALLRLPVEFAFVFGSVVSLLAAFDLFHFLVVVEYVAAVLLVLQVLPFL